MSEATFDFDEKTTSQLGGVTWKQIVDDIGNPIPWTPPEEETAVRLEVSKNGTGTSDLPPLSIDVNEEVTVDDEPLHIHIMTDADVEAQIVRYEKELGMDRNEFERRFREGTVPDTFAAKVLEGLLH